MVKGNAALRLAQGLEHVERLMGVSRQPLQFFRCAKILVAHRRSAAVLAYELWIAHKFLVVFKIRVYEPDILQIA
jgi:hypothetical protein